MNIVNKFVPENFFPTLKEDVNTLWTYRNTKKVSMLSQNEAQTLGDDQVLARISAAEQYSALEKKAYAAGHRVLGAVVMGAGSLIAAKIILPIITFKFCLAVAFAVATFAVGKDGFEMARKREQMHANPNFPAFDSRNYLLAKLPNEAAIDELTEKTLVSPLWKAILLRA